mgnify:FL=1
MFDLSSIYRPETAMPESGYREYMPSEALSPFIRCFWEMREYSRPVMIIPDTCMDIVFSFVGGELSDCGFCAIDDRTSVLDRVDITQFGIRFYAWSACLFTQESFSGTKNSSFDARDFFPDIYSSLLPWIVGESSVEKRIEICERYLYSRLDLGRMNSNVMNGIYGIISSRGMIRTAELAHENAVSVRQLERSFSETVGISPKLFSSLIRYQLVWQELRTKGYSPLDITEKFGYSDQSHLLRDFRRFHSLLPSEAIAGIKK